MDLTKDLNKFPGNSGKLHGFFATKPIKAGATILTLSNFNA